MRLQAVEARGFEAPRRGNVGAAETVDVCDDGSEGKPGGEIGGAFQDIPTVGGGIELKGGRTVTSVSRLGVREREEELARMIAGSEISASVRASAREMLKRKGTAAAR